MEHKEEGEVTERTACVSKVVRAMAGQVTMEVKAVEAE
jgi:hypothetical protein